MRSDDLLTFLLRRQELKRYQLLEYLLALEVGSQVRLCDPHGRELEKRQQYHPFALLDRKNLAGLNQHLVEFHLEIKRHSQRLITGLHIQKRSYCDQFLQGHLRQQSLEFWRQVLAATLDRDADDSLLNFHAASAKIFS